MSRGAVFSLGSFRHFAEATADGTMRIDSFDGGNVPQTEPLEMGKLKSAQKTRDIPDRIRSSVAVGRSIRKLTDSYAVEDYKYQPMILQ